jgi:carboxypeptidase C (cathepsin A)
LVSGLKFNGSVQFNNQTLQPWIYNNKEVGQIQSTDQLTFIRVYEAGHEVPYYQPENALAMFYQWIAGDNSS